MAFATSILESPRTSAAATLRRSIALRTQTEIGAIRRAGRVVRAALEAAASASRPGATTASLNAAASCVLAEAGATSLLLGHPGGENGSVFPACVCVNVNEDVLHGIPGDRVLVDGDVVSIDCAASLDGWCADAAVTVKVGSVSRRARHLCDAAELVLAEAVRLMQPGRAWTDVAGELHEFASSLGVSLVGGYAGHGIGRLLHEAPSAPCVVDRSFACWSDFTLRPGMVLAIEPVVTLTPIETFTKDDGWTVAANDGSLSVHVEHTVAITRRGAEVLTDGR